MTGTGAADAPVADGVARLRVLVVDDSIGYGMLVSAWLDGHADLEVVGAVRTPEEALEALLPCAPDVLVLDYLLPDASDSRRVLERVRSARPGAAVILVSSMPVHDLGEVAAAVGADHFISKAADVRALSAAIQVGVACRSRTRAVAQQG